MSSGQHAYPLGLARPLTEAEREALRSALPPGQGPHTAEEISRAQCDAQLRIAASTHEEGPPTLPPGNPTRGVLLRPRGRPPPFEISEEARLADVNEYHSLVDLRAYSPNRRAVGFSHLDPAEIACDNVFEEAEFPDHPDEAPHRSPSPFPEPGSAEYMFAGSMGDDMGRPSTSNAEDDGEVGDFQLVDAYAPRRIPPQDPSIHPEDLPALTQRLRELPVPYMEFIISLRTREQLSWEEAFYVGEEQHRLDRLVPSQRRICAKVAVYRDEARLGVEVEDRKRLLYHEACVDMFEGMGDDGSDSYLAGRQWMAGDTNTIGDYIVRDLWWNLILAFWKDDRPEKVLAIIISNVHRVFRCAMYQRLEDIFQFWIDAAGNIDAEIGWPGEGHFWRAWEEWEQKLLDAGDFCEIDDEEALELVRSNDDGEGTVRDLKSVLWILPYPVGAESDGASIDYAGIEEEMGSEVETEEDEDEDSDADMDDDE